MGAHIKKITALVITYNEIGYIEDCMRSVAFADEIIVVDSYSTDGTYEYLCGLPRVRTVQHPFKDYTSQKAYALALATNDWVLFLDADEVVPPALRNEIRHTVMHPDKHVAYWFRRSFMFQRERLYFSGWQTDKNYRLFRKSKVRFSERRIVHETLEVNGSSGILRSRLIHYCYRDFDNYRQKMLKYGRMKAKEAFRDQKQFRFAYLLAKPAYVFLYNYVVRLGILDGIKGLTICYLNALGDWERYLELRRLELDEKVPVLKPLSEQGAS